MTMPSIAVVVPVYNRAEIVTRTLDSIASQTSAPQQIILVDNNSSDSSLAVIQDWAKGRDNVIVLSEATPGAAAARSCGLGAVKTDYVMFFDSDDAMAPTQIAEILDAAKRHNNPDIIRFEADIQSLNGKVRRFCNRRGDLMFNQIFHSELATVRYAVVTSFLRRAGSWNQNLRAWDDYELGVRLLTHSPRVVAIKLTDVPKVFQQEDSITGMDFSSKYICWETALDEVELALRQAGWREYAHLIDYRRAILAGQYRREGHPELSDRIHGQITHRRALMCLIDRFIAAGGRGVAEIARVMK